MSRQIKTMKDKKHTVSEIALKKGVSRQAVHAAILRHNASVNINEAIGEWEKGKFFISANDLKKLTFKSKK